MVKKSREECRLMPEKILARGPVLDFVGLFTADTTGDLTMSAEITVQQQLKTYGTITFHRR